MELPVMQPLRPVVWAIVVSACVRLTRSGISSPQLLDADAIRIDPATGFLRDSYGRVRIFHGVNVVMKETPWYPPSDVFNSDDSLDSKTIDLLRGWGFNVVRLGVMWPGVEPSLNNIDHAYLEQISKLASDLASRGVYTLIDLHQDLGSRRFCGEGFPEFYVDALLQEPNSWLSRAPVFPRPLRFDPLANGTDGLPLLEECLKHTFSEYYLTDKVGALWRELYTPDSPLNQGFSRYWAAVAAALRGKPEILGYELLNEPSGYCLGEDGLSCKDVPGVVFTDSVEAKLLTPLYQAAARVIRPVDPDTPIFYEATVVPKMSDLFPAPPLGEDTQQGLAYHIYCQPRDGADRVQDVICHAAQDIFWHQYVGFVRKHQRLAGFMTEFGAVTGNQLELEHLDRIMTLADTEFQSWAYWELKKYHDFTTTNGNDSLYNSSGVLLERKLRALSRTYAQAIAGTPSKMTFDSKTSDFEVVFQAIFTQAPTVVYLNEKFYYPDGFEIGVDPENCLSHRKGELNYIEFFLIVDAACTSANITIKIKRAQVLVQV